VRISINKLDLIPDRIVAGLVGVFRNSGGLGMGKSYIPVMFFDPLLHRSPCFPDVDFAALTGNPIDNTILSIINQCFGAQSGFHFLMTDKASLTASVVSECVTNEAMTLYPTFVFTMRK